MKQFIEFVRKEFYHILRDTRSLLLLLVMPIALMIIFGFAITNEIKNNNLAIYDLAKDAASQKIISSFRASKYFNISCNIHSTAEIEKVFQQNKASIVIIIPAQFTSNLVATNRANIQIIADGSDPNTATSLINYATAIIRDYQASLAQEANIPYQIQAETRMLYNPELKSAFSFVPGVMGLILMLITAMMTSVAIVKEKELGTMEVLLVSPLNPFLIVISKAIPYFIIGIVNVLTIIALSVFVMGLPVAGSFILLLGESTLFIICCLSLGLLISTLAQSQQVALLISMLVLLLPTMMLSGFIFPIENMPVALQWVSNIVPAKWYILMIKAIMLKGLGVAAVWKENFVLVGMTLFFLGVSIKRFNIRLE
ncbi:MAG: ABC transporter permease [Ginsengibacter sp.]